MTNRIDSLSNSLLTIYVPQISNSLYTIDNFFTLSVSPEKTPNVAKTILQYGKLIRRCEMNSSESYCSLQGRAFGTTIGVTIQLPSDFSNSELAYLISKVMDVAGPLMPRVQKDGTIPPNLTEIIPYPMLPVEFEQGQHPMLPVEFEQGQHPMLPLEFEQGQQKLRAKKRPVEPLDLPSYAELPNESSSVEPPKKRSKREGKTTFSIELRCLILAILLDTKEVVIEAEVFKKGRDKFDWTNKKEFIEKYLPESTWPFTKRLNDFITHYLNKAVEKFFHTTRPDPNSPILKEIHEQSEGVRAHFNRLYARATSSSKPLVF